MSKMKDLITNRIYGTGWVPDIPDNRDLYRAMASPQVPVPSSVDLRENCPPVYNQGSLGSCTANAIGGAIEFLLKKQGLTDFTPARLFIYYNERAMEGTIDSDAGAMIRDGVKCVNKLGVCPESELPYDISKFTVRPTSQQYKDALDNVVLQYQRVPRDLHTMKSILANGFPFVIGFSVYSYFESLEMSTKGVLNIPDPSETLLGGHAVLVVGYNDDNRQFIVRNSWSDQWGLNGYFMMTYDYLLNQNLSDDFWELKLVK